MKCFSKKSIAFMLVAEIACGMSIATKVNAASLTKASTTSSQKMELRVTRANGPYCPIDKSIWYQWKINDLVAGKIKIFANDNSYFGPGTRLNNSKAYKIGSHGGYYQCAAFGLGCFYFITGDFVGHGTYSVGTNSKKVICNKTSISYSMFVNAGVKPGSYFRTTPNSNGSYNGNKGHSGIIVSYDSSGLMILEGNADGKGLVKYHKVSWNSFNKDYLQKRGYRISHIYTPT